MLTDSELIRYKRQLNIPGWDEDTQERLKKSSVFVAGAGGLGSPVLYYLAAAGVGHITICDRDRIEESNLNRQILYKSEDIGGFKAETASVRLSALNNTISISHVNSDIGSLEYSIISKCSLIIDCFDNFESRHILNRISLHNRVPMIHAGVSEFYGQVTFIQPGETPCLACFIPDYTPSATGGILGCVAGVIGSIQAVEAIKYLTGTGGLLKNRLLHIDLKTMSFAETRIKKNPECKICN